MNTPANQAAQGHAPAPRRRRARWPFWLAGLLALPLLLVLGVWLWIGSDASMRQGLGLAGRFLPEGQSLQYTGAAGSIARGGRVERLQWSGSGITVLIEDLELDWVLSQLLDKRLQVNRLRAGRIQVTLSPQPEPPPSDPFMMPARLTLPVQVELPLEVARIEIGMQGGEAGAATTYAIDDVRAHYVYDDVQHRLRLESLAYGQSHLQAAASLHARELILSAQLAASLRDLAAQMPLAMLVHADAQGTLAGADAARIELALDAREQPRDATVPAPAQLLEALADLRTTLEDDPDAPSALAQLFARAAVHPWRSQPLDSLQVRANRLNAAAFHASAPLTSLAGEAQVLPVPQAAESWDLTLALRNGIAGAWDEGRLPVQAVDTQAQLTPEQLRIETAQLTLAGEPDGTVALTGHLPRGGLAGASLQLQLQQVDLRQLMTNLPVTRFAGAVQLEPLDDAATDGWQARTEITNASAGRLDEERLPLDSLAGAVRVTPSVWQAESLQLRLADGSLQVSGQFAPESRALDLRAELRRLPLAAVHGELATGAASAVSGTLDVSGALDQRLQFDADIASDAPGAAADQWNIRTLRVQGDWAPTRLRIGLIDVDALGARIEGEGVDITLPDLASIEAHLDAQAPGLSLQADASMRQRSGGGTLSVQLSSAGETLQWLRDLPLLGEQLPDVQAVGSASLAAEWQGGWQQWREGFANPRRHPQLAVDARLVSERLQLEMAQQDGPASMLELTALDAQVAGNLAAASLVAGGSVQADERAATLDVRVQMRRDAEDASIPGWQLQFERMAVEATLPENPGPWRLALADGLVVELDTGDTLQLRSTAGELSLMAPATAQPLLLAWEPLELRRTSAGATRLQSRGTIQGIQPAWLDVLRDELGTGRLQAAGLGTDLMLSGEWDLDLADALEVHARIRREQGDLWLLGDEAISGSIATPVDPADRVAAGIRSIDLAVDSTANEVTIALDWQTTRAGIVQARASTHLTQAAEGWRLDPQTPVAGDLTARLQELGMWGILTPPGWRLQGELDAQLTLEGTVETPLLRGPINGSRLNVRSVLDGIELHDGTLRAALEGQQLTLTELVFQGGTGSSAYISGISGNRTPAPSARGQMRAEGGIDWSGVDSAAPGQTGIAMDMQARLERMQVLVRNDRQLTLSGDLSAALQEGTLRVRGDLNVIRATILLPDAGAPTLGDDVIVVRDDDPLELVEVGTVADGTGRLESARPMDVEINLDLGRDLALNGYGITTRLEGELTVRSSPLPTQPFSVFGEVRTNEGRYRAWGQALNVETGEVAFNGSYENPSLNLLAIRPEIDVRAGVRVTGTLRAPQVELYSDPPLPEAEKLSWVVLGRPTAIGGGEGTSVQRAALGLLAGRAVGSLADDLGVDELGLGDSGVSIGKRISDQLYVTYEAGLSGAASTLYIFYDITRRFTVRGESGEANAVDLIYSFDFD